MYKSILYIIKYQIDIFIYNNINMKYLDFTLLFLLIIIMLCQCQNYHKKEQFNNYKATESESYDHHRLATLYNGVAGSTGSIEVTDHGTMGNGPYDSWISPLKTHLDNFYTKTGSYATGSSSKDNITDLCESNMTPLKTTIRDLGSYGGNSTRTGIDYIPNRDKKDNMFYYNVYGTTGDEEGKAYDRNFNEWDVNGTSTLVTNMACKRGFENIAQYKTPATPAT